MSIDNQDAHEKEGQDTVHACIGCASTARIACQASGAAMPPATGTHRSDSSAAQCRRLSAVGISGIHAGEDVKHSRTLCFWRLSVASHKRFCFCLASSVHVLYSVQLYQSVWLSYDKPTFLTVWLNVPAINQFAYQSTCCWY